MIASKQLNDRIFTLNPVNIYLRTSDNPTDYFLFNKSMIELIDIKLEMDDWENVPHITNEIMYDMIDMINYAKKFNYNSKNQEINIIQGILNIFFSINKAREYLNQTNLQKNKNTKIKNKNIEKNIHLLIYTIFRTKPFPLKHIESYEKIFKQKTSNDIIKGKLINTPLFNNSLFSYLNGNTIFEVYQINDFINNPLYGKLIEKYDNFKVLQSGNVREKIMINMLSTLKSLIYQIDNLLEFSLNGDELITFTDLKNKIQENEGEGNKSRKLNSYVKGSQMDNSNVNFINNLLDELEHTINELEETEKIIVKNKYFFNTIYFLYQKLNMISSNENGNEGTIIVGEKKISAITQLKNMINNIFSIMNAYYTLNFEKIKKINPNNHLSNKDIANYLQNKNIDDFFDTMKRIYTILLNANELSKLIIDENNNDTNLKNLSQLNNGYTSKILMQTSNIFAQHLLIINFLKDTSKIKLIDIATWTPNKAIPDITLEKIRNEYPEELKNYAKEFADVIMGIDSTNDELQKLIIDKRNQTNENFIDVISNFSKMKLNNYQLNNNDFTTTNIIKKYGNVGISIVFDANKKISYQIYLHINLIKGKLNANTIKPFICEIRSHYIGNELRQMIDPIDKFNLLNFSFFIENTKTDKPKNKKTKNNKKIIKYTKNKKNKKTKKN